MAEGRFKKRDPYSLAHLDSDTVIAEHADGRLLRINLNTGEADTVDSRRGAWCSRRVEQPVFTVPMNDKDWDTNHGTVQELCKGREPAGLPAQVGEQFEDRWIVATRNHVVAYSKAETGR